MPVTFTLPLEGENPTSVKDMVFSVLTREYPRSLIELLNTVKSQYAVSVSFQSVRKAVLQLVNARVLVKEGKKFAINREWILDATKFVGLLQKKYFSKPESKETKIQVGPNVTVYTFSSLLDMDATWNDIMRQHFASKPEPPKFITFEAVHFWFVIVTLAQETELIKEMLGKGIKLYYACYGHTPLDTWTVKHYNDLGVTCKMLAKQKEFTEGHNIGVYGDLVIHTTHPKSTTEKMNRFFKKYKRIEEVRLSEITDIVSEEVNVKLTVIKDPLLAKTVRENVINKLQ